ncbi:MAG: hypothetical protein JNK85_15420 [Verrucomicrobiales bacterium]|nr:hypothetical protein [Verrucomicrobiales bacterium]
MSSENSLRVVSPPPNENVTAPRTAYHSLDAAKIIDTAATLQQRVRERFPSASLTRIAEELVTVSHEAGEIAAWLARPIGWLRAATWIGILALVALFVSTLLVFRSKVDLYSSVSDYLQGLDAAVNELVFLGIAIFFLRTIETRFKRRRALKMLHVLRSMSHIIDMHQLTKDPERLVGPPCNTPSSPNRAMSAFELTRYLDYCSEMLAVISKLAALHVQNFDDPVTLSAVNDIEDLTQGLSRKIWQKIMILDRMLAPRD